MDSLLNLGQKKGGNNHQLNPDQVDSKSTMGGNHKVMAAGKRSHKRSHKRKGGNVLSELAVPAVLLLANQRFGNKSKKNYSKRRFSRRRG